ncbi:PBP1A family penicillin-binding protein [Candidatus Poribacteria bacterium]|jgi:1A family penicillin-binding protein|nr:PBP1A family penicillin-binding protein [Candidatus Poribacteria bacterium]MBT5710936.1 PBP1A family penicillin-binding protein [Candidatus Poribacteria bacterium]MBT7100768.1 PBP1A family penicillin-binding protein [Candidatus Poribacteria bacterium]MBT7804869.1 PBP1A family penicillin-binding protein [Candidatus Poribacteria bacterium]
MRAVVRFFRHPVMRFIVGALQVIFVLGVVCALTGTAFTASYIKRLANEVPTLDSLDYGEIKTWRQHTEVYSEVAKLEAGVAYDHTRRRLERLIYQRMANDGLVEPGTYYEVTDIDSGGIVMSVYPRPFTHPRIRQDAEPFRLVFRNNLLHEITGDAGDARDVVYLEPELLDEFYNVDEGLARQLIRLSETPVNLTNAFLAIEDNDFYAHSGVHPRRFAVAMVRNVMDGRLFGAGASTITQQLAKNLLLTRDKTIPRKVKEWIIALRIEQQYSKEEIFERYLNFTDFGRRSGRTLAGVKEATRFFFDKDVSDLNLQECALLAAVPNSPTRYSPVQNPGNAKRRRDLVLRQMHRRAYISNAQYAEAVAADIELSSTRRKAPRGFAPHFTSHIRQTLENTYTPEDLYSRGLRVYTTVDPVFQELGMAAVNAHLLTLDAALEYPSYSSARQQVDAGFASTDRLEGYIQGALVMVENRTGYVRAFVGGRDFVQNQYSHVTQARRQPGSAFKPIVFTAAWEHGLTPQDKVLDEPWSLADWTPENYRAGVYSGEVDLEEAVIRSLNIPTARMLNEMMGADGPKKVVELARRLGITGYLPPYPALALGVAEVTLMEMATAYTAFPNLGIRVQPVMVRHVVTLDGQILEENVPQRIPSLDPQIAHTTNAVLQQVMDHPRGTGGRARRAGFTYPAGGKTGTTSDYTDSWFIGYTRDVVTGVWVGFDDPSKKTDHSGSEGALPIWTDFMRSVTVGRPVAFARPQRQ